MKQMAKRTGIRKAYDPAISREGLTLGTGC